MKNEGWQSDSRKQWSGIDFEPGAKVCGGRRRADGHPLHLGKPRQEASIVGSTRNVEGGLSFGAPVLGHEIHHLLGRLEGTGRVRGRVLFVSLFEEGTVEEAVATFLALLELVKRGFVRCFQGGQEDDLTLEEVPESERPDLEAALATSEFDEPPLSIDEGAEEGVRDGDDFDARQGDDFEERELDDASSPPVDSRGED